MCSWPSAPRSPPSASSGGTAPALKRSAGWSRPGAASPTPSSRAGFVFARRGTRAEALGARRAARGHRVSVDGRRPHIQYGQPTYRGMRIVLLPTLATKYLDTVVNTFLSVLHVAVPKADVVFACNVANSP